MRAVRGFDGMRVLALALWVLIGSPAGGQTLTDPVIDPSLDPLNNPLEPGGPYEGRFVAEVTVLVMPIGGRLFEAPTPALEQLVRNQIRTGRGTREYSASVVAGDLSRLNRLGRFASVRHLVSERADGSVQVTYELREQPIVRDVQITGNRALGSARLGEAIETLPGTPVDEFELNRAARAIEDLYRERGFTLVEVRVNLEDVEETGVVLFEVREGPRVRITEIRYEGNDSIPTRTVRGEIGTKEAGFFDRGTLDRRRLREDANAIARYYQDRGYLDARVDFLVQPSPDGREGVVTFYIVEGELYSLRRVIARHTDADTNGPVLTSEQVVGLIGLKPGDTFSARRADQAVRTVREAYGKMGYVDARVRRQELRDTTSPAVDLLLTIQEGRRFRTGLVQITGNKLTRHSEVRKGVKVKPDRPLDTTAVEQSERIVTSSRLFDLVRTPPSATVQAPRPEQPTHRDVLLEVTETNTGLLSLGASVNSDIGLTGQISYEQRNFDITDWPDSLGDLFSGRSLRGGGQTLTLAARPGTEFQRYELSLADNSLRDSFVGGTVGGGFQTQSFDEFSTERLFFETGLRRRFGDRWVAATDFRWQSVNQFDLEPSSTTDAFAFEGTNQITGLGATLRRTTVPPGESFRPTGGSITRLSVEQVGILGGDFDFTKLGVDHTVFLTVREDFDGRATVLRLRTSADWIPQGQDDVPTYERYFLGGRSFRGFEQRTVAPRGVRADNGEIGDTVGGTFLFFAGAELQQPVAGDTLALAFFVDSGTVTRKIGLSEYRVSAGVGIRLYVPQLSPAPLAFDFAVPIASEDVDEDRLFTFAIDLPI
ncbi:MAG: outer membrane protein assembly factor BamA [Planctomycetota bacterium]